MAPAAVQRRTIAKKAPIESEFPSAQGNAAVFARRQRLKMAGKAKTVQRFQRPEELRIVSFRVSLSNDTGPWNSYSAKTGVLYGKRFVSLSRILYSWVRVAASRSK